MLGRIVLYLLLLASLLPAGGCRSRPPEEEVWAEVNGQPIYRSQVEKYYEQQVGILPEPPTPAEEQARKLNIVGGLIQNEILWQKAAQAGIQASDAEVEARLAELRASFSEEEFQQQLGRHATTLADLKAELRRELAVRKLLDRTLGGRVEVSEQEITDYYEQHRTQFRFIEAQYRVAHILVTPRRETEVRNLRTDDAASESEASRKTQLLLERLRAGDDFAQLARAYSEDPTTALAGGDLGFFPESALQESHPSLRSAVERLEVGAVAGPIRTQQGYEIIKLLEREAPGQRDPSDPAVREDIRERLRGQKRQLLEQAYISQVQRQARVTNYLARQILESHHVSP
jgi:peptidyl-prolyl cis-trans isomerase SurA